MSVIELGGGIELAGFRELDRASIIVLKKMVGNYARKMSDSSETFEKLSLTMKKVHEREKSEIYEMHGKLIDNGKAFTSKVTDRNLFFAIDKALNKIMAEIKK